MQGLAEEVPTLIDDAGFAWRTGGDGGFLALRAMELGRSPGTGM
jgi:hypothetical protein